MQYFGTDSLFLSYIVQFLKPTGAIGFASAGLIREFDDKVPEHLVTFWQSDAWGIRTAEWWGQHWARTGLVELEVADEMCDGWRLWLKWAIANNAADWYLKMLERDAGRYLGYVRGVARRRADTPDLPCDLRTGEFPDGER
ncbi:MAG: hypothetical protein ACI9HK_003109 [Pirellulaceae bacterium]|jgi:hypothetical protein